MEINSKEQFILDTSAFISLESCNLFRFVVTYYKIITTKAVITELIEFSKYNDRYGKVAQRVLIFKNRFLMKSTRIKDKIQYIEETDNELYNLSRETKIPLVTDDHRFVHHAREKIDIEYSTMFLVAFTIAEIISKKDALRMLDKLRDLRNWKNNIIYQTTKEALDSL